MSIPECLVGQKVMPHAARSKWILSLTVSLVEGILYLDQFVRRFAVVVAAVVILFPILVVILVV